MRVFPVNLLLEGKTAVVVGAGTVGARKVRALLDAGADVRVAAESFCEEFEAITCIERIEGPYEWACLADAAVVIAATDDADLNARISRDARAAGALVSVVDAPGISDFVFPAVAKKGDVAIAVSTGGASPTLAKRLKNQIADVLDDEYAALAKVLGKVRAEAIASIADPELRREYFETLAGDSFLAVLKEEGYDEALMRAEAMLEQYAGASLREGS